MIDTEITPPVGEMVASAKEQHTAPALELRTLPSVWSLEANIEWLIDDILPIGSINLLSAASGTGKTWVAHAIAGAVAQGTPFLGFKVSQRPVLYFDGENPLAIVKRNVNMLGISECRDMQVWGGWLQERPPGPADKRVREFARQGKPLLIWDSLVEFHPGDEQSSTETREFMKQFRALADAGATVVILHHTGKAKTSKEYRGSSDIAAAVDMAYTLDGTPRNGGLWRLVMRNFKSRFAPGQSFGLEYLEGKGFERVAVVEAPVKPSAEAVVQEILGEELGLNGKEIKERAKERGVGKNAVDRVLRGWPSKPGRGREKLFYPRGEAPRNPEIPIP